MKSTKHRSLKYRDKISLRRVFHHIGTCFTSSHSAPAVSKATSVCETPRRDASVVNKFLCAIVQEEDSPDEDSNIED